MTKKTAKPWYLFDAAGWQFWTILFVLFAIAFFILGYKVRYKDTPLYSVFGLSVILGATTAAIVSWGINSLLQNIAKRRKIAEKKAKRKNKV